MCVGCDAAGGDDFCGGLDLLTPACDDVAGSCVGCDGVAHAVCGDATPVCGATGGCVACTAHDECPDSACHLGPDDPLQGHCFAPEETIWIDNQAACPGVGTMEEPACSLRDVTDTFVPGESWAIRLVGGMPYAERSIITGDITVAIVGEGSPEVTGVVGQQAATFIFDDGVTAYMSGVRINGNPLTHGIMCNFSSVYAEDIEVRDNGGWGIFDFDPCTLDLNRAVIVSNDDGGVRLNEGQLTLHNSTVALNGLGGFSTGVRVEDGNVDILYSTIAGNDGLGDDSLECTAATGTLRNSIVMGADATSISLDCFPLIMEHNALDSANFAGGTNVEVGAYDPILFNNPGQADFRLSAPPLTPFGDVALWLDGDPELDADGTARPMGGMAGYCGIDEP